MRCNNCGWKNLSENEKCEKCNALLESDEFVNVQQINIALKEDEQKNYTQTISEKGESVIMPLKTLKIDER